MTFLETLHANRGGLIRLKTQLYWYETKSWDDSAGRICLILDARPARQPHPPGVNVVATVSGGRMDAEFLAAQLMIDGSPQWVWIDKQKAELLTNE
jgi:hypothetical protein